MSSQPVPPIVQGPMLIKKLSKEIVTAEQVRISPNPPKLEQEARRKMKKPANNSFFNYRPSNQMENAVMRRKLVPPSVQGTKFIKSFNKDIETAQRNLNSLNPFNPVEEAKRKTINQNDFSIYPYSLPNNQMEVKREPKDSLKAQNKDLEGLEMVTTPSTVPQSLLKLTIPKPGVYPCTSSFKPQNKLKLNSDNDTSWLKSILNTPNVVIHPEEKVLKVIINNFPGNEESPKKGVIPNPYLGQRPSTLDGNLQKCRRASPSAKEANAGVLSITQKIFANKDNSSVESDNEDGSPRRKKRQSSQLEDVLENMDEINQDKDNKREKPGVPVLNVKEESTSNGIETLIKAATYIENCSSKFKSGRALPSTKECNEGIVSIRQKVLVNNDNSTSNGIEKLIKAFYYIENCSSKFKSGRALPSTKECNEGIVSIRQKVLVNNDNSSVELENEGGTLRRRIRQSSQLIDLFENMDEIHQDEDYIYPSLDSSEEEKPKKLGKSTKRKVDKAWNPQRRIGHVAPKTDRPCRVGTKNKAVEKALQAAAAKRASLPPPKRSYIRKKPKLLEPQPSSSGSSPYLESPMELSSDLKGQQKPKN